MYNSRGTHDSVALGTPHEGRDLCVGPRRKLNRLPNVKGWRRTQHGATEVHHTLFGLFCNKHALLPSKGIRVGGIAQRLARDFTNGANNGFEDRRATVHRAGSAQCTTKLPQDGAAVARPNNGVPCTQTTDD